MIACKHIWAGLTIAMRETRNGGKFESQSLPKLWTGTELEQGLSRKLFQVGMKVHIASCTTYTRQVFLSSKLLQQMLPVYLRQEFDIFGTGTSRSILVPYLKKSQILQNILLGSFQERATHFLWAGIWEGGGEQQG